MKIIQTFWSGEHELTSHKFGWHSAQHHWMGWALSCLCLREFYDDVELYTDRKGHQMLIEKMQLPYTKVHVMPDDFNGYSNELWALAKLKTYALQEEPFLHVDGDVFIWAPFPAVLTNAGLIAQNLETGTSYYKNMMDDLQVHIHYLPPYLTLNFELESCMSCNMGITGGSDLAFFKEYVAEAFRIVDNNNWQQIPPKAQHIFNVVFEQFLFYSMSKTQEKTIACYFKDTFIDNGYAYERLADFTSVPFHNQFLHLLGQHKSFFLACDLMSRTLLQRYPSYYYRITDIFRKIHKVYRTTDDHQPDVFRKTRFMINHYDNTEIPVTGQLEDYVRRSRNYMIKGIYEYENSVNEIISSFSDIPKEILLEKDLRNFQLFHPHFKQKKELLQLSIVRAEDVQFVDTVFNWYPAKETAFPEKATAEAVTEPERDISVAIVPEMFFEGYREIFLDELDYNILYHLEESIQLSQLLSLLEQHFDKEDLQSNYDGFYQLVMLKLKNLHLNKCIKVGTYE